MVVAEQLDLSKYCSRAATEDVGKKGYETQLTAAEQPPKPVYSLVAISNHSGSMHGGHCTAQCKSALADKWFDFDDAVVSKAASVSGPSKGAYMLFYKRQS